MAKAGWNWIQGSTKWHWFGEDGRSLCRKYLAFFGNDDAELDNHDSPDNCKACAKLVNASESKRVKKAGA